MPRKDVLRFKEEKERQGRGVYLGRVGLQGSQVVLQGQAAPVVQHGLHARQVSLHQLLLLTGCLLLQGFHHGLEVLRTMSESYVNLNLGKKDVNDGEYNKHMYEVT